MSTTAKVVGGVVGVIVLVVVLILVTGGIQYLTAPFRGEVDARERTQADGAYRIAAYEQFYDDCAAIQALEDQIAVMKADKSLPADQRNTNVLALTNQRNTLIRNYNGDAAKADTRGAFRASDLPYTIDPTQETTTCTA